MTQREFLDHLTVCCGCIVIREDKQGYSVVRNVINGKMSGVAKASNANGQLKPATICRTCKTLDVEIPEEAQKAMEVVEHMSDHYPKSKNNRLS